MRTFKSVGLALAALLLVPATILAATPQEVYTSVQSQFEAVGAAGTTLAEDPSTENVQAVIDANLNLLIVLSQQTPDVCATTFYVLMFDFALNNVNTGYALLNGEDEAVIDYLIARIEPTTAQLVEAIDDCEGVGNPDAA